MGCQNHALHCQEVNRSLTQNAVWPAAGGRRVGARAVAGAPGVDVGAARQGQATGMKEEEEGGTPCGASSRLTTGARSGRAAAVG